MGGGGGGGGGCHMKMTGMLSSLRNFGITWGVEFLYFSMFSNNWSVL